MNTITAQFLEDFGDGSYESFRLAMEKNAAHDIVGCVNWPEEYPYAPECEFFLARGSDSLAVLFHVRGLDLRAKALEDGGSVWEDSCCEFFVEDPSDGTYYNFEMNCIGTLLNAKGSGRNFRKMRTSHEMSLVKRYTTLPHKETDSSDKIFSWSVGMKIPFSLIGVDPTRLPEKLRGNFYKCGDKTAHPHFLSWNPVQTPSPDFHRPEYFGELILGS